MAAVPLVQDQAVLHLSGHFSFPECGMFPQPLSRMALTFLLNTVPLALP